MNVIKQVIKHPYITRKEGVCGGRSIIEDTRITVWILINWYKLGNSFDEIMKMYPDLTSAQCHSAFAYYYDNIEEIEEDIADNENEEYYRQLTK